MKGVVAGKQFHVTTSGNNQLIGGALFTVDGVQTDDTTQAHVRSIFIDG